MFPKPKVEFRIRVNGSSAADAQYQIGFFTEIVHLLTPDSVILPITKIIGMADFRSVADAVCDFVTAWIRFWTPQAAQKAEVLAPVLATCVSNLLSAQRPGDQAVFACLNKLLEFPGSPARTDKNVGLILSAVERRAALLIPRLLQYGNLCLDFAPLDD